MKKFLTPEGLRKLKIELEWRKDTVRKEIAQRLATAVERGDLTENAEFTAAKDEQMFNEGRIQELENLLTSAMIIENHQPDGVVSIGSKVTVLINNNQKQEYRLVGSAEADPTKGLISDESPIGKVLLGKKVGQVVVVDTPRGKTKCKIIKIE